MQIAFYRTYTVCSDSYTETIGVWTNIIKKELQFFFYILSVVILLYVLTFFSAYHLPSLKVYSTQKRTFQFHRLHLLAFMSFQTCFFHLWNSTDIIKNVGNPTKLEPIDFDQKNTWNNTFQNCMTLNIIQVCAL